jgi:outer membrane receptor protein involved in Fe transport
MVVSPVFGKLVRLICLFSVTAWGGLSAPAQDSALPPEAPAAEEPTAQADESAAQTVPENPMPETPEKTSAMEPTISELEQLLKRPVQIPAMEQIVTSASRRQERAPSAPGTVIVIDREDIVRRGYSQLKDVLRDLPGMETIEMQFTEFGTQVPVRGISGNNKIVVLVNGMRVNPPGGENFPFRSDFSVRHAERVEVVYGAGATLYGQDAISAVINVVTQEPTEGRSVQLGGQGGVNFERELWGSYRGDFDPLPGAKISTYLQYHDSELTRLDREFPNYWQTFRDVAASKTNANGAGVIPNRNDYGLNIFGRLEWEDNSVQVWHRQSERSSAEGYIPGVLGFLPGAQWGDSSTAVEAKNTSHLSDKTSLQSILTYNRYEIDPRSRYIFPAGPANPTQWFLDDYKYGVGSRLGLEELLNFELTEKFSVLAGGLVSHSDVIPKATFNGGGFDPQRDPIAQSGFFMYSDIAGGPLQSIPQASDVQFWTYALYTESQWQMFERLKVIGGVRVTKDDRIDTIPVTPRAALIYDITERLISKYMYTQAFVAPAPYFAFATYDRGDILATTNPNVSPETADTHEINLSYYGDDFSLGLSGYYGTQSNLITVSDRVAPQNIVDNQVFLNGDPGQPRTLVRTANGGESTRYGTDFYGKAKLGSFNHWFSYSYVDFAETSAGLETGLPGISRHNGRLGSTWQATPKLSITPSLVIRSTPENVVPGKLASELETPWEINLYALHRFTEHMDLFFDLRNLTDHHYALGGFSGDAIPQETFRGTAGLRVTY